uniref:Monocyte to macrophage differentiation factor 2 n=2 Tax=Mesocestoides corti TaxID=53468 RepID=A0A5K3F658_MESCO
MWKNPRPTEGSHYSPTTIEKVANFVTHLPWVPLSACFANSLFSKATNPTQFLVACIYGVSLVSMFGASTTFHCCTLLTSKSRYYNLLHYLDRTVIFVFIAASYTPWLLLREFKTDIGILMLKVVWTTALCGAVYQLFFREKWKLLSLSLYLAVGILPAISVVYMVDSTGLHKVGAGGLVYILGAVFFKMDGVIPMAHAIWHCFVALAAYIHFLAIDRFLFLETSPP